MINYKNYPNIGQSWGIFGITVVAMLGASPIYYLKGFIGIGPAQLLTYLATMGLPILFAYTMRKNLSGLTKLEVKAPKLGVLGLVIIATLGFIMAVSFPLGDLIPMPDYIEEMFKSMMGDHGVFTFLTLAVAAPILEEVLFRGIVLDGLLKKYSPVKAILFSAFLFGIVHLNPWQFVPAFFVGIFMGWIYYRTRNLTYTIIIHFVNNSLAFTLSFLGFDETEELLGTPSSFAITVGIGVVVFVISAYLLKRIFSASKQPAYDKDLPIKEEIRA
ncbi:MAG: lysostaphin resistance A-like protein [Hyphomicrobiales bacterium]